VNPKKAYDDQKRHAEQRGISWEITYSEWLEMWLVSGKWEQRGRGSDTYCMCRHGDVGPYSQRNCYIDKTENNQQTRWENVRKVLPQQYLDIVKLWLESGMTQYAIAEKYGVDQSYISKIISKYKKVMNEQLSSK